MDELILQLIKKTHLKQKMYMIGTEEYNNESTRMNAASMIYNKNKEFKLIIPF